MMIETELRKLVRDRWIGWIDWVEPRGNAGVGHPDCELLIDGVIAPVELKIGEKVGENTFKPSKIRPNQISWHQKFRRYGGRSFWLFASSKDDVWIASRVNAFADGYKVFVFDDCAKVDEKKFADGVTGFIRKIRLMSDDTRCSVIIT